MTKVQDIKNEDKIEKDIFTFLTYFSFSNDGKSYVTEPLYTNFETYKSALNGQSDIEYCNC